MRLRILTVLLLLFAHPGQAGGADCGPTDGPFNPCAVLDPSAVVDLR